MKRTSITLSFLLLCSLSFSQKVEFLKVSWSEVLSLAKERNKPIFVDLYTASCGPCKKMDKEVFTDPTLSKFINDSLIPYKMDMGIKENRWIIEDYHIGSYPTFLYFSPQGELIYRSSGSTDINGLTEITRKAIKMVCSKPFSQWQEEYISNKTNPEFLFEYIKMFQEMGLHTGDIIDEYLNLIPENQRYNKKNLELVLSNAGSLAANGTACKIILTCRDTLLTRYTELEADEYFDSGLMMYAMGLLESAAVDTNEATVDYAISVASRIKNPYIKEPGYDLQMRGYYYGLINDYTRYADNTIAYIEKYYFDNYQLLSNDTMLIVSALNKYSGNFFNVVSDDEKLLKALNWCNKCIELSLTNSIVYEYFYNTLLDTKANLLYKIGNKPEALKLKEQALSLLPVNDNSINERSLKQEELEKMKKGLQTWY
ncbi:MAG TPA: thioredoxin family protein [Lentimicrobium sp.]|nr:thioredoxin family protein [Lentimicrobium sp.]